MKIRLLLLASLIIITATTTFGQGKICDGDCTCVFTLEPRAIYNTTNPELVEGKMKEKVKKPTACVLSVWTDGNQNNKIYKSLVSYSNPILVRDDKGNQIVKFQYLGNKDDGAVEAFNDVVFVDHDFTLYLTTPEHYCHGLPLSPTQYISCTYCGVQYKKQIFYNTFTEKSINIFNNASGCNKSPKGNHDNLDLIDVPSCPKLNQPDCDQTNTGGDINK